MRRRVDGANVVFKVEQGNVVGWSFGRVRVISGRIVAITIRIRKDLDPALSW